MCVRYAAWQWQRRARLMQQCRAPHATVSQVQKVMVTCARVTGEWQSCYVCFHECVRTSKIYVRDCTPVPPLAMLLFCKSTSALSLQPRKFPAMHECLQACMRQLRLSFAPWRHACCASLAPWRHECCAYLCGTCLYIPLRGIHVSLRGSVAPCLGRSVVSQFPSPCLHPLVIRSLTAALRHMAAWRGSRAGGGEVKEDKSYKGGLVVDGWLGLEVAPAAVPMLLELRRR